MADFKMDDYVPVNERIEAFYKAWPQGTLQSEIVTLTDSRVTIKAYAYRAPDDARPGIGHSSEEIPGKTSFTKGSEIENAETSAWGRAIAALGFEVKRGVASREEVRNKQPERRGGSAHQPSSPRAAPAQRSAEEQMLLDMLLAIPGMSKERLSLLADAVGVAKGDRANADQLRQMLAAIESPEQEEADPPASPAPASPTMDDILAVTGGEEVPPKPGTPEYEASMKVPA